MDLNKMFLEEDNFPKKIASYEMREWGILFYDKNNRLSRDSNHALIYEQKVQDIDQVLEEIVQFYQEKDISPIIYQSIDDEGYIAKIADDLDRRGFSAIVEPSDFMALTDENTLEPNEQIVVKKVAEWDTRFSTEVINHAVKIAESQIAKVALQHPNTLFFVAYINDNPVGILYGHITNDICRIDRLFVSKNHPNIGVDSTLIHHFVEYCHQNNIENCYLWPDDEFTKQIYFQAGFRVVETKQVACAYYVGPGQSVEDRLKLALGKFRYNMYKKPGKVMLYSAIAFLILFGATLLFKTAGGGLALFMYPVSWVFYALDRSSINMSLRKYKRFRTEKNQQKVHEIIWQTWSLARAFGGLKVGRSRFDVFGGTIFFWIMPIIAAFIPIELF